mgnify:FL=1
MLTASTDIRFLKGVGEKRAELLRKKGIDTVGALLRFYPRAYLDWQNITPISECHEGENVCVRAEITSPVKTANIRRGMTLYKFSAADDSGVIEVTLFNRKYLAENLREGRSYLFYGKLGYGITLRQMSSPEIMPAEYMGIEPVYAATEGLSSKTIEKIMKNALVYTDSMQDAIPDGIRQKNGLCDFKTALKSIHFPLERQALESAKRRLVFEELFVLQTGLLFLKRRRRALAGCTVKKNLLEEFKMTLSFKLTGAQERVINECLSDMMSPRPMNRLIQGDVGSGKTAVAAALMYISAGNGFQSALMAPTELLAEQHFKTLCKITENSGIKCALLTGSLTKKQKDEVKAGLKSGEIKVAVGTHALLTDDVEFESLGLVVTDEQHRFGVGQRGRLSSKGNNPHTLVMSATPIPRTLGLIIYGDLDISIIDEYPAGRQKIATYCVDSSYNARVYNYIKKFIAEGRQAYIVCPLVDENEALGIKSASEYYEELSENQFKDYTLGLLHGKMKPKDKESVMRRFAAGEIQLLISTTVIEVGIDVPNAALMVIENAERFGLSQLHQLRGRIGRGEYSSACILISDVKSGDTKRRLDVIKNNTDGFKIADEDLKLRGPGDFLGSRQHGLPDMKIADIFADRETLHSAGKEAEELLRRDPMLHDAENAGLRSEITELFRRLNGN